MKRLHNTSIISDNQIQWKTKQDVSKKSRCTSETTAVSRKSDDFTNFKGFDIRSEKNPTMKSPVLPDSDATIDHLLSMEIFSTGSQSEMIFANFPTKPIIVNSLRLTGDSLDSSIANIPFDLLSNDNFGSTLSQNNQQPPVQQQNVDYQCSPDIFATPTLNSFEQQSANNNNNAMIIIPETEPVEATQREEFGETGIMETTQVESSETDLVETTKLQESGLFRKPAPSKRNYTKNTRTRGIILGDSPDSLNLAYEEANACAEDAAELWSQIISGLKEIIVDNNDASMSSNSGEIAETTNVNPEANQTMNTLIASVAACQIDNSKILADVTNTFRQRRSTTERENDSFCSFLSGYDIENL